MNQKTYLSILIKLLQVSSSSLKKKRNFGNAVFFNESFDHDQNPKFVMPSKIEV
jgi:hypothetical protein